MASSTQAAALNIATAGLVTGSGYKSIQTEFETLPGNSAPIVERIGYGKALKTDETLVTRRIVDRALPQTVTNTVAMVTAETTITLSTTDAAVLQVGQVLMVDAELLRVTAAHATVPTITRGVASTTATTHAQTSTVHILSPNYLDTDTFVESPKSYGEFKDFVFQQIMYQYSQTAQRSAIQSYMTKGQDELAAAKTAGRIAAQNQLAKSIWYGKAVTPTGSTPGMFAGIRSLVSTNATAMASAVITPSTFNDTAAMLYAFDNTWNDFDVYGNMTSKRIWDALMNTFFDRRGETSTTSVGTTVDQFRTSLGTFNFIVDPTVVDGELYFLKTSDWEINPLDISSEFGGPGWNEMTRKPEHTNALTRAESLSGIFTLTVGDERRHAKITGFSTTASAYTGYV